MNEFDDLDDLDEVLGPLRGAATPAECSHETAVVDLMVNAHRTSEEKHMFTSRRARIATLVVAGVLGFGGMAAASPSLLGDQPVENDPAIEVEEQPVDSIAPETTEPVDEEPVEPGDAVPAAPADEEPVESVEPVGDEPADPATAAPDGVVLVDDPATAFDETTCLPGNHGATVSAVARGLFPGDASVTDAAQSSCGKTATTGDDVADDTDGEDADEVEEPATEPAPAATERPAGPDTNGADAPGKSKGKSDGKSNGKSGNANGGGSAKGPSGKPGG